MGNEFSSHWGQPVVLYSQGKFMWQELLYVHVWLCFHDCCEKRFLVSLRPWCIIHAPSNGCHCDRLRYARAATNSRFRSRPLSSFSTTSEFVMQACLKRSREWQIELVDIVTHPCSEYGMHPFCSQATKLRPWGRPSPCPVPPAKACKSIFKKKRWENQKCNDTIF